MNKEPKIYELNRWEGQMPMCGETAEYLPAKIQFENEESIRNDVLVHRYSVSGNMWDIEFNTGFKFTKSFEIRKQAEIFFFAFKKKYPHSRFGLFEIKQTILKEFC